MHRSFPSFAMVAMLVVAADRSASQSVIETSGYVSSLTQGRAITNELVNFKLNESSSEEATSTRTEVWDSKSYTSHGRAVGRIERGSGVLFEAETYSNGEPTATYCCNPYSNARARATIKLNVPSGALARVVGRFAWTGATSSTLCKSFTASASWVANDGLPRKSGGCSNTACTQAELLDTLGPGDWTISLDVVAFPNLCPNASASSRFYVTFAKTAATVQSGKTKTSFLGGSGWHGGGTFSSDASSGGAFTAELDVANKEKLSDALSAAELAALDFALPGPELLAWKLTTTAQLREDPTISIRIDPAYLGEGVHPQDLSFYAFHANDFATWTRVPSRYDTATRTLTAQTGDFERLALGVLPSSFRGTPNSISILDGGKQDLTLAVDPILQGQIYLMLGSASGTSPGTPVGNSMTLPLNIDAYMQFAIGLVGSPIYPACVGILGSSGQANMAFALPKGLDASLIGTKLAHACWVYDFGAGRITHVSNAVPVSLVH